MKKFACAIAMGHAIVWVVLRWGSDSPMQLPWLSQTSSPGEITWLRAVYDLHLVVMFVVLPTIAAMLTAGVLHALIPRVAFLGKGMTWRWSAMLAGVIILLSLLMAVCLDVYGFRQQVLSEFASCFAYPFSCAISTFVVLLATRRSEPGLCTLCRYDITHSINFGRCPECGTAIMTSA